LSASEFAFLALGLVLGVASGAALIEVLRARPSSSREIRVTMAPNAIHGRSASTLSDPHGVGDAVGPARGGPGDRRWQDEIVATGEPAATGRRIAGPGSTAAGAGFAGPSGTRVLAQRDETSRGAPTPATARASSPASGATAIASRTDDGRPAQLWLSQTSSRPGADLVAVPMSMEPDPVTTAIRASAALSALAAMTTNGSSALPATASGATGDAGGATGSATGSGPATPPGADGPCAEGRRVADERCAVANRAREGSMAAAEALRRAQRSYDEIVARGETAAATADPRSVRTAKELAQQRFRNARNKAGSHEDVENGARAWLAEINQINHDTREAALGIERDRAAAAALGLTVERLAVEADAARISAERADEACVAAREAVATCDEARNLEAAAARSGPDADDAEDPDSSDEAAAAGIPGRGGRIAAAMPEPEDEFAFSTPMNSQAGQDALIQRILRGERDAMERAVARLAGDDPEAHRHWQAQLGALMEALIARSIEASSFDFPIEHPFWGAFSQSQNRDIAAGLSSLGFRFDGFGNWVDERQPSQRDLSLAVGYAGLDPMRIRRWPNESETRELLQEVRVAADEYIAGAAGGLTLGELVTLLGRRADGLAELWNEWGSVRPILLEAN
jgi:hypothetical protein